MPRPSQSDKILEAALHCFATYGYDATRIKHIAEAAGVSEGALYRHYPSKEAVAITLFAQHLGAYVRRLQAIVQQHASVQEQLREFVYETIAANHDDPDGVAFVLLGPPLFGTLPQEIPFPLTIVTEVMRHGQAAGVLRAGNPVLLAAIFLGCVIRPIIVARSGLHDHDQVLGSPAETAIIADAAWSAVALPQQSPAQATVPPSPQ
jgi:AcrR family transcriptional regulator